MKSNESVFAGIADSLAEKGWAVSNNFFDLNFLNELLREEMQLYRAGKFKPAGIGKGAERRLVSEIRSDYVHWLDEKNLSELQKQFWNQIQELKNFLNREFFLSLKEMEFHFAVYPAGSFYKKHLDRFQRDSRRAISCVLYLNQNRQSDDGGELRIYEGENIVTDIIPEFGRFVCFKSDETEHEVLPTKKERYSITGWLKN